MNFKSEFIRKRALPAIVLGVAFMFFAGVGIGILLGKNATPESSCEIPFRYLNPGVDCKGRYPLGKQEYLVFRDSVNKFLESQKAEGKISSTSIYFRDLLYSGPTFGIEERVSFSPASLLKVPFVLTFLKFAEDDPAILQKQLVYERRKNEITDMEQFYVPAETIEERKPYSIEDLLTRIIVFSDNNAYDVLFTYLIQTRGSEALLETYRELGMVYPQSTLENTISVKSYASMFRLLYQASYLSPELSEKALTMLARSDFKMGLVAGVPEYIMVAHKFGERTDLSSGTKQLHDCGIVYYPENPYLLCVMARGKDFQILSDIIAQISERVYQEVDSRKLEK